MGVVALVAGLTAAHTTRARSRGRRSRLAAIAIGIPIASWEDRAKVVASNIYDQRGTDIAQRAPESCTRRQRAAARCVRDLGRYGAARVSLRSELAIVRRHHQHHLDRVALLLNWPRERTPRRRKRDELTKQQKLSAARRLLRDRNLSPARPQHEVITVGPAGPLLRGATRREA